jgi:hypothetical protein
VTGPGGNDYGAQLCTAHLDPAAGTWTGTAFGNGAFFEATLSFTGAYHGPGPGFWVNGIETMYSRTASNRNIQWPYQPLGFGNWIEADVVEFNAFGLHMALPCTTGTEPQPTPRTSIRGRFWDLP